MKKTYTEMSYSISNNCTALIIRLFGNINNNMHCRVIIYKDDEPYESSFKYDKYYSTFKEAINFVKHIDKEGK